MCEEHHFEKSDEKTKLDRFNKLISNKSIPAIVMFYADWCGHCQRIKPIFLQYSKRCTNNKLIFILVNVDTSKEITSKYNIEGFPTFILFKNNTIEQTLVGADEQGLKQIIDDSMKCTVCK